MGVGNGFSAGVVMTMGADMAPRGQAGRFLGLWRLLADIGATSGPLLIGGAAQLFSLAVAGPLEVFDMAGWDTISHIIDELFPSLDTSAQNFKVLKDMVAQGDLGVKSGRGFYNWNNEAVHALRGRIVHALSSLEQDSE